MKQCRPLLLVLFFTIFSLLFSGALFLENANAGQKGSLSGLVTRGNGALLSNAQIILLQGSTVRAQSVTDDDGNYRIENLDAGNYRINAFLNGHHTYNSGNVSIDEGEETVHNLQLTLIDESPEPPVPPVPPEECNIYGERALNSFAFPGSSANQAKISINIVDENKLSSGIIIKEYLPSGWTLTAANPAFDNYDPSTGEIKWVFTGDKIGDLITNGITYSYQVPLYQAAVIPGYAFFGVVMYIDPDDGIYFECPILGTDSVDLSLFNPYDFDKNWEIGDFELLEAVDEWADETMALTIGEYCSSDNEEDAYGIVYGIDFYLLDLIELWANIFYHPDFIGNFCFPWQTGK